jgi:N-acetylmuramoyl-L-alanine amidase
MSKKALIFFFLLMAGCAAHPYRSSNKESRKQVKSLTKPLELPAPDYFPEQQSGWIGTVNFDLRKPNFVIIHHTAQAGCPATLHTFTISQSKVSAHYLICRDGTVHHLLSDYLRAWQAGLSKWGNNTDINSSSIGIELDNNGFEAFPDAQMNSLLILLDTLKAKYNIPVQNFIGHGDVAPGRKVDPSWHFSWKLLADHGFGLWYDDTAAIVLPVAFDPLQGLRNIGYSMKDTMAVIAAFKRHWLQDSVYAPLDSTADKIIYNLSGKF